MSIAIAYFLWVKITGEWSAIEQAFAGITQRPLLLMLVFSLIPFNWLMEALKWKVCVKPVAYISLSQAYRAILAGVSLRFVMPGAIGDYIAKLTSIDSKQRAKTTGGVLVGRIAQLIPSLVFGGLALLSFTDEWMLSRFKNLSIWLLIGVAVLAIVIYALRNQTIYSFSISYYLSIIKKYTMIDFTKIIVWSLLRYGIYTLQFLVLLAIMGVNLSLFKQVLGIGFMFLAKTIIPAFHFLSDLGVRELSAILYFEQYQVPVASVVSASLLLWLCNIAIPGFFGLFLVPRLKLKTTP